MLKDQFVQTSVLFGFQTAGNVGGVTDRSESPRQIPPPNSLHRVRNQSSTFLVLNNGVFRCMKVAKGEKLLDKIQEPIFGGEVQFLLIRQFDLPTLYRTDCRFKTYRLPKGFPAFRQMAHDQHWIRRV